MKFKFLLPNTGKKLLIWLALIISASYAVWWYDSIVGCEAEEGYTVHGACLNILVKQAEAGRLGAMVALATHFSATEEGDIWALKAAKTGNVSVLDSGVLLYCKRKAKGFSPADVESWMKAAYAKDPATAYLLADLYTDFPKCGTRNLQLAAHYLPLYPQCRLTTLDQFVTVAIQDGFYIDAPLRQFIIEKWRACGGREGPSIAIDRTIFPSVIEKIRSLPASEKKRDAN
ncbi:hypothetical protein [Undibacterium sp.]|uniref:hypothetical protein n=1 Tax=Undibacterium sp. TaxID=1914977 RepID=UPI00374CCBEB